MAGGTVAADADAEAEALPDDVESDPAHPDATAVSVRPMARYAAIRIE